MYGTLYWHIESLKDPFVIVADSAFIATVSMEKQRQVKNMLWLVYIKLPNRETALLQDASEDS